MLNLKGNEMIFRVLDGSIYLHSLFCNTLHNLFSFAGFEKLFEQNFLSFDKGSEARRHFTLIVSNPGRRQCFLLGLCLLKNSNPSNLHLSCLV